MRPSDSATAATDLPRPAGFRRTGVLLLGCAFALASAFLGSCAGAPSPGPAKPPVVETPEERRNRELAEAATLLGSGRSEEAVAGADKIAALAAADPNSAELRMLKAAALTSAGKLPEARAELDALLAAEPSNPKALAMAAELARFAGDERGRRLFLDRGLAAAPRDADVLAAWGQLHLDRDDWLRAEESFRRALEADGAHPDAWSGLGRSLYKQAKYADSEAAYDKAVALEPGLPFGYADRSRARYQLGKYVEAEADLDAALVRAPDSAWIWLDRGRMRLDSGRVAEAEADLSKAIALDPSNFLAYVFRGGLYEEAGRDAEALADYEAIIKVQPDYWYAHESAGAAAYRLGRFELAATRFKAAYGNATNRYEYAILVALSQLLAGKPAEAKAWAGSIAPRVDREKDGIYWLALRLLQDQNDQSSELEIRIQAEKRLDVKAAMLFYLGEYWVARGKGELGAKYLLLSGELNRRDTLEYRLLKAEAARLGLGTIRG